MGLTVEPLKRKKLQLLDGGLSLATPGDKVPPSGALDMQNFRSDTQGRLRSRSSSEPVSTISGSTPFIHSLAARGANIYFGADTELFTGINPSSPIITGFDGNPLGMVAMNGYTWIMNRSKQVKYDTSSHQWGFTPPSVALTGTAGSSGNPNGVYTYFVTFLDSTGANESNPSPASAPITLTSQVGALTNIATSTNPDVTARNVYRAGGNMGGTYLVATINNNTTTFLNDNMSDLTAVAEGVLMQTNHDLPPAAWGLAGPYFGYVLAFSSAANVNRLWWSLPEQPQYWPGAALGAGQWTDIGNDGEAIIAVTIHTNVAVIYKQFSVWRIVGTPDLGYLEQVNDKIGITGFHSAVSAGQYDYISTKEGVYKFDFDRLTKVSPQVDPIFRGFYTTLLGSAASPTIQAAPVLASAYGQVALGYMDGRLFVSYPEAPNAPFSGWNGHNSNTLVYSEDKQEWATWRIPAGTNQPSGFDCFFALSGQVLYGAGWFRLWQLYQNEASTGQDDNGAAVVCHYQSRYEDAGQPDNQKVFVELVIDYEFNGDTADVYLFSDNGAAGGAESGYLLGTITGTARQKYTFALGVSGQGLTATNVSIRIECAASEPLIFHAIYLYAYPEAASLEAFSTLAMDFGTGKVKQCKEVQIDAENNSATIGVNVYTDLPGNALTVRQTPTVPTGTTRRPLNFPISLTEGRLWRVALTSAAAFRLYAIRLLMRVMGTYVEAYESANGFVWDSFPDTFESSQTHVPKAYAIALHADPIKRARELELRIDAVGSVTVTLLSDLPGDALASRYTHTLSATSGQQAVRLPLPAGLNAPIEGRLWQLQLSSATGRFILYEAGIEILPVGVYVEAYEAAGGAVYDSREVDFGSEKPKEAREIEIDIETTGNVTATLLSDLPGGVMTQVASKVIATNGRQKVPVSLTPLNLLAQYPAGRMFRLILTGANAFRLYGAKLKAREFGAFLTLGEAQSGVVWDSTPVDLGIPKDKVFDQVRFEVDTDGDVGLAVYSDLPGESMISRFSSTITTVGSGRRWVTVPLPATIQGRLIQCILLNPTSGFRLYQAQVFARSIGRYIASTVGDAFRTLEWDAGSGRVKLIKKIEVDVQADGPLTLTLSTDQSGTMAAQFTATVEAASTRAPYRLQLPPGIRGRLIQVQISGTASGRVYALRAWVRQLNEPGAGWEWKDYPLETSDALQQWFPLAAAPPTAPEWSWAPFPVNPTDPQWNWVKFLSVEETPDTFEWIDIPVDVTS